MLEEKGQEEARKIMRKKKGILDASDIGGLPEGFEGNVGDLFAAWGAPTELTEAEQKQKEKDEQEKAEKLAKIASLLRKQGEPSSPRSD